MVQGRLWAKADRRFSPLKTSAVCAPARKIQGSSDTGEPLFVFRSVSRVPWERNPLGAFCCCGMSAGVPRCSCGGGGRCPVPQEGIRSGHTLGNTSWSHLSAFHHTAANIGPKNETPCLRVNYASDKGLSESAGIRLPRASARNLSAPCPMCKLLSDKGL